MKEVNPQDFKNKVELSKKLNQFLKLIVEILMNGFGLIIGGNN